MERKRRRATTEERQESQRKRTEGGGGDRKRPRKQHDEEVQPRNTRVRGEKQDDEKEQSAIKLPAEAGRKERVTLRSIVTKQRWPRGKRREEHDQKQQQQKKEREEHKQQKKEEAKRKKAQAEAEMEKRKAWYYSAYHNMLSTITTTKKRKRGPPPQSKEEKFDKGSEEVRKTDEAKNKPSTKRRKLETPKHKAEEKEKEEGEESAKKTPEEQAKQAVLSAKRAEIDNFLASFQPQSKPLAWPTRTILSRHEQQRLSDLLCVRGHWGVLQQDGRLLARAREQICTRRKRGMREEDEEEEGEGEEGVVLTFALLRSLRFWALSFRAMTRHSFAMKSAQRMKQMYDRGEDIGSISHQLDVPPMTAFRAILTARGWSKQRIRKAIREPSDRQSGFGGSSRDMAQLAMAQSLDVVTNNDQARQIEDSERFESIIEEYLKVQGIRFKRQEELTEEQQLLFDRAVNTPDFVLLDSVSINSKPVRWIEAKNFFGADLPFPQRDIHKQLSRYCSTWGPGAVIFSLGYCESFQVPEGVMLLDASVLDLSSLLTSEE